MIRGLYTSVSGMLTAKRRMEVVTNNIANVQTTGFKQDRTASMTFDDMLIYRESSLGLSREVGPLGMSNLTEEPLIDLSQGTLQQTGRELDLALEGPALFTIQTPDGVRYTRDGTFARDAQGQLVTPAGDLVLGQNGPIRLPIGQATVDQEGTILVDGTAVDRLRLVEFAPDQPLRKVGDNFLVPREEGLEPAAATTSTVRQGFVETSNVDMTGAQTSMLELQRAYEANQRLIQFQDEMTGRAVNDIARPV